jgi:hypothetical protein
MLKHQMPGDFFTQMRKSSAHVCCYSCWRSGRRAESAKLLTARQVNRTNNVEGAGQWLGEDRNLSPGKGRRIMLRMDQINVMP